MSAYGWRELNNKQTTIDASKKTPHTYHCGVLALARLYYCRSGMVVHRARNAEPPNEQLQAERTGSNRPPLSKKARRYSKRYARQNHSVCFRRRNVSCVDYTWCCIYVPRSAPSVCAAAAAGES